MVLIRPLWLGMKDFVNLQFIMDIQEVKWIPFFSLNVKEKMSLMGELNYFLSLLIKQLDEGTIMSQTKYCKELLKRFGMEDSKSTNTPIPTNGNLDKDEHGKSVDDKKYRDLFKLMNMHLHHSLNEVTSFLFISHCKLYLCVYSSCYFMRYVICLISCLCVKVNH